MYYYNESKVTQTSYLNSGIEIFRHENKIQKVHDDGKIETLYPDGRIII